MISDAGQPVLALLDTRPSRARPRSYFREAVEGRPQASRSGFTALDICLRSACQESCGFALQGACYRSPAACRGVFSAIDPFPGSVSLVCASQFEAVMDPRLLQETIST